MKTKNRTVFIRAAMIAVFAILVMSVLIWAYFCSKSYGDLSIYDITILETADISTHGYTLSREEFHNLLELVPSVEHCPRFQFLKYVGGKTISLTPKDIVVFFLYSGDEETIRLTKDFYSEKLMTVTMSNRTTISVSAKEIQTGQPYGKICRWTEKGTIESRKLGGMGSDHGCGMRVNVYATFERYYNSPTSYGVAFLGYTTKVKSISDYYERDHIESENLIHSDQGNYSTSASFTYYIDGYSSGTSNKFSVTANAKII